jgi:hypothetical protein
MTDLHEVLERWHDFYVLVGTGGAALTGLLFVVVSLGPNVVAQRVGRGVRAFISPIATHFIFAFVLACIMLAPGMPGPILATCLAGGGLGGAFYTGWTSVHVQARNLSMLDRIWFAWLPLLIFLFLFACALAVLAHWELALYGIAAATVMLIVTGLRNAWDIVLWMAQQPRD